MPIKGIRNIKTRVSEIKVFKIIRNKYFLVTVAFLVGILFIDTGNLFVWFNDMQTVSRQRKQIEYYKEAIRQTDEKLQELRSNKDSLEKFAREQYLFHTKDEEVFIITE